jgi:hypothetical protein
MTRKYICCVLKDHKHYQDYRIEAKEHSLFFAVMEAEGKTDHA